MTIKTVKSVGVAGSGDMGSGIAEVAARAGFDVVLRGRSQASANKAFKRLDKSLSGQVAKDKLSTDEHEAILGRVRATDELGELELCDLVVESVVEDLDVKRELFRDLDRVCDMSTLLATNTSTFPVVEMAMATDRPDRVVGLHFFNPAPRMPLVEIVPALTTADDTVTSVREFAEKCGKEPVTVKDRAGFVVNALLFPYLNNAIRMLESGVASRDDIDSAMRGGCGFPMGPFQLLDLVGLDTSLAILQALQEEHNDDGCAPAPLLKRMVTAGHLGRKAGQGFHTYESTSR